MRHIHVELNMLQIGAALLCEGIQWSPCMLTNNGESILSTEPELHKKSVQSEPKTKSRLGS